MGFAPADDNDKHLRLPFMYHDFQVRWYSDNVQVLGIVHRLAVSYRRSIFNHEITMQASVRYWTIVNMERPALLACGPALCSASTRSVTHELRIGAGRSILTNPAYLAASRAAVTGWVKAPTMGDFAFDHLA
jgi:hypothetical protein